VTFCTLTPKICQCYFFSMLYFFVFFVMLSWFQGVLGKVWCWTEL
jgi:hypothetical protein